MNYVFFDVECANCLHGEGKICSFGYVKTDADFRIIRKKDILIDPDAKFLLGNVKSGKGIHLAYPLFRFRQAHTFPKYYQEIGSLLSNPENLVFGFAVFQDVSYLAYTCQRYKLPFLNYRFFDVQKMEKEIHQSRNPNGLDTLVATYHLKNFTYHRSDDDAHMTMEVYQALLKETGLTVKESLSHYAACLNDAKQLIDTLEEHKKMKARAQEKKKKISEFFESLSRFRSEAGCYDADFWEKKIYFEPPVYDNALPYLKKHAKDILHKGGKIIRNPMEADYVVTFGRSSKVIKSEKPKIQYMDFSTFQTMLKKK